MMNDDKYYLLRIGRLAVQSHFIFFAVLAYIQTIF